MSGPQQDHGKTAIDDRRLAMATRIAAGMCANPEVYARPGYEVDIAHAAWSVAGALLRIADTGGA